MTASRDNAAYRFPVSVKGVILRDSRVILLKNDRGEWELPGGKLEPSETPEACVAREIDEELGLRVSVSGIIDSWVYAITPEVPVLVVTYGCAELTHVDPVLSSEHKELAWFALADLPALRMPAGYKRSIAAWARQLSS